MTTQTAYRCDVTGDFISEEEAVPIRVVQVRRDRRPGEGDKTRVEDISGAPSNAEHVSRKALDELELQALDFTQLEIIVLGEEVVGWRDYSPSVKTEPRPVTDEVAERLKEMTYL